MHSRTYRRVICLIWSGCQVYSQCRMYRQRVFMCVPIAYPGWHRNIYLPIDELLPISIESSNWGSFWFCCELVHNINLICKCTRMCMCVCVFNINKLFRPPHDWRADANKCHKTPAPREEKGNLLNVRKYGSLDISLAACSFCFVRLWLFPNWFYRLLVRVRARALAPCGREFSMLSTRQIYLLLPFCLLDRYSGQTAALRSLSRG